MSVCLEYSAATALLRTLTATPTFCSHSSVAIYKTYVLHSELEKSGCLGCIAGSVVVIP